MNLNVYPFNDKDNKKGITEVENNADKLKYIFTIERYEGGDAAKYDNVDLSEQEYQKFCNMCNEKSIINISPSCSDIKIQVYTFDNILISSLDFESIGSIIILSDKKTNHLY